MMTPKCFRVEGFNPNGNHVDREFLGATYTMKDACRIRDEAERDGWYGVIIKEIGVRYY